MKTEKNEMNGLEAIKSFIYLDTDKMYSISSQLFSGLTEYVLTNSEKSKSESESHKELLKGNQLADIIVQTQNHQERKYLHDYAYTLFENRLLENDKVLEIDNSNFEQTIQEINTKRFIKVTGRVFFNDSQKLAVTMQNFNEIGYAIGYVAMPEETRESLRNNTNAVNNIKDRNQKAKVKNFMDNKANFHKLFNESGLHKDPEWLKQLVYVLNFGFNGNFEIQLPFANENSKALFSSILNRNMFKEDTDTLIRKYSRETEKEFTIFGIATQTQKSSELPSLFPLNDTNEDSSMKESVLEIVRQLSNVENSFSGKANHEYVIDPIAVYIEL